MIKQHYKKTSVIAPLLFALLTTPLYSFAKENKKSEKGLLDEVRMDAESEEANQEKAMAGELLVSKAEESAIKALEKILAKKRGTSEQSDLELRLAELHVRRAKTGRFFDLYKNSLNSTAKTNPSLIVSAKPSIEKALVILYGIEKRDPTFSEMPNVLFNIAFAQQAIGEIGKSQEAYLKLVSKYPNSSYIPDSLLSLGEMSYDKGEFEKAISYFEKINQYPSSRAYPYAMYKSAWASYNLKRDKEAIDKLLKTIKGDKFEISEDRRHNLRQESLRDLVLFTSESVSAEEYNSFFKKVSTTDEYRDSILLAAKLFESHSRHSDLIIILNEFINSKVGSPADRSEALNYITEAHENLKQRKEVLETLKRYNKICLGDISEDGKCAKNFRKATNEITTKWWEIWQKNKNHKEFSELTQQALEIELAEDQGRSEDAKTRLSYADLLFQQQNYAKASEEYLRVSQYEKLENNLREEALYSSLISSDKLVEARLEQLKDKKSASDSTLTNLYQNQLSVTNYYLQKIKGTKYSDNIQFKRAYLLYQLKIFTEALPALKTCAKNSKNADLKTKAQDLILDILNSEKKYAEINSEIQGFLKETLKPERKAQLTTWLEEAAFADLNNKEPEAKAKIANLENFIKEHPQSKLVRKSQLMLIPLYFEVKEDQKAAELIYQLRNSSDLSDKPKMLQLASESFMMAGSSEKAYEIIRGLDLLSGCEYLSLLGEKGRAKGCYMALLESDKKESAGAPAAKTKAIKYLFNNLNKDDKDLARLIKQIENQGLEPWLTELQLQKANELLAQQKFSAAFEAAKKIMGKDVDANLRARARLIQAKILESELKSQSVKSRAEKLAMVLSMKTEKLDKAHTAYFSTTKMTSDADVLGEAFAGIQRCYDDYIKSMEEMPIPEGVNEQEAAGLKQELAKLLEPIKLKRKENGERIKQLGSQTLVASSASGTLWFASINYKAMKFPDTNVQFEQQVRANVLNLMRDQRYELAGMILALAEKVFQPETNKNLWIYELQALQLGSVNNLDKSLEIIEKKISDKSKLSEVKLMQAWIQSQKDQFKDSLKLFSSLDSELIYNHLLEMAHINSAASSDDKKLTQKLVKDYGQMARKKGHVDRLNKINTADPEKKDLDKKTAKNAAG